MDGDAFVAEVAPSGAGLVYAGYIGGANGDSGDGIAVDGTGAAYVMGNTGSDQTTFPVVRRPRPDSQWRRRRRLRGQGRPVRRRTGLLPATSAARTHESGWGGIALDGAGAVYVTGVTGSDEASFPVRIGPDLTFNGSYDAYVAKVSPVGRGVGLCRLHRRRNRGRQWVGHRGGRGRRGLRHGLHPLRPDHLSGGGRPRPDLQRRLRRRLRGQGQPVGTEFVYAGYIGGADGEEGHGIAVDEAGAAYVTGSTSSDQTSFPVVGGPDLTYNDFIDAFVAKIDPSGAGLVYAGYIGGSGFDPDFDGDQGYGIALDAAGAAYVTGYTSSRESSFPVRGGPDLTFNGDLDAFVAKVNGAGNSSPLYLPLIVR